MSKIKDYWQSRIATHHKIFPYFLALGLIAYGQRAFNNYLYADDFWRVFDQHRLILSGVPSGRFMMSVVWYLTGADFAPAFSTTLFLLLSAGSAVVIARLIGARDDFNVFLFSSLMIFNPIICSHIQFLPHHLPLALGFVFVAITSEIFHQTMKSQFTNNAFPTFRMLLLCSLVHALLIGIRQDFATLTSILFIAIFLKLAHEQPHNKITLRLLLKNIALAFFMFILSIFIYYLLNKLSLQLTVLVEPTDGYGTFSSLASNRNDLMQALDRTKNSILDYFINEDRKTKWSVKCLIAITTSIMAFSIIATARQKFRWNIFISIFFGLCTTGLIIVLPWTIAIFRNFVNSVFPTALIGLIATWSFLFSYVSINGYNLTMRRFAKFAGISTLIIFLSSASHYSFQVHTSHDQLKIFAVELINDIHHVMKENNYPPTTNISVIVANSNHTLPFEDGYIIIEWVLGMVNTDARLKFMEEHYLPIAEADRNQIRSLISTMPEWPSRGYVQAYGDFIVVKLNPKAPYELSK